MYQQVNCGKSAVAHLRASIISGLTSGKLKRYVKKKGRRHLLKKEGNTQENNQKAYSHRKKLTLTMGAVIDQEHRKEIITK